MDTRNGEAAGSQSHQPLPVQRIANLPLRLRTTLLVLETTMRGVFQVLLLYRLLLRPRPLLLLCCAYYLALDLVADLLLLPMESSGPSSICDQALAE
mgnify:CR=1 FL=1